MDKYTFMIREPEFEKVAAEMMQMPTYCHERTPFFRLLLDSRVGYVSEYSDWRYDGQYYVAEAVLSGTKTLEKFKLRMTSDLTCLHDVLVFVSVKSSDKFGHYQIKNGFTRAGYSVKNDPTLIGQLKRQIRELDGSEDKVKVNIKEIAGEQDDLYERNSYAFFINENTYQKEGLMEAAELIALAAS